MFFGAAENSNAGSHLATVHGVVFDILVGKRSVARLRPMDFCFGPYERPVFTAYRQLNAPLLYGVIHSNIHGFSKTNPQLFHVAIPRFSTAYPHRGRVGRPAPSRARDFFRAPAVRPGHRPPGPPALGWGESHAGGGRPWRPGGARGPRR